MKLEHNRLHSDDKSTLGGVFVDDKSYGFFVEDEFRLKKIKGETRIPAGTYQIKLRTAGGFHERYKNRYPNMHKGMLELQDVPGFKYILIHPGNDEKDTAGCLCTGSSWFHDPDRGYVTRSSGDAYKRLYPVVAGAIAAGKKVSITIRDIPGEVAVDDKADDKSDKKAI